ncbi:MAG: hypothetical protein GXO62_00590 [Epsilonproteobacteria bacterium]|nr:hypothetical protein [Campylobacterota bacterium]
MSFDFKNRLDLAILTAAVLLVLTGAFLRFFKYFFTPDTTEKLTYLLIPEVFGLFVLISIKLWRK